MCDLGLAFAKMANETGLFAKLAVVESVRLIYNICDESVLSFSEEKVRG